MESIEENKTDDTFSVRFDRGAQDGQEEPTVSIQVDFLSN